MKKLIFIAITLIAFSGFANAKPAEVKTEIKTEVSVIKKIKKNIVSPVIVKKNITIKKDRYCMEYTMYWFDHSYVGMDGETYDVYRVTSYISCYF